MWKQAKSKSFHAQYSTPLKHSLQIVEEHKEISNQTDLQSPDYPP